MLALGAAGLHTTWNLLLKTVRTEDRDLTSWGLFLVGGLLVVPVVLVRGGPGLAALPWLALSAVIHLGYVTGLTVAYRDGDFSLAYPLLRGSGALVAAIVGGVVLGDHLPPAAWFAISIVVVGLVALVGRGTRPTTVRDAVLTGVCIGAYTVVDAHGVRVSSDAIAYGLSTTIGPAVTLSLLFASRGRAPALRDAFQRHRIRWSVAGLSTAVSYAMVVVAARYTEVGRIAVLRESSVVLGVLAGWLLLGETMGRRRLLASGIVVGGMVLLVLARG